MKTLLLPLLPVLSVTTALAADGDVMKFFENEVRPILANRCYECHGEKKQKGGLRLDHITHIKTGGDTGPAVVPGQPDQSALIEAVRYKNSDLEMPPKEKLPPAEIAVLEKWVALGAPWPQGEAGQPVVAKGGFTDEQRQWWSFQPVRAVTPPSLESPWIRNDIDRFIAQKHREQKLEPSPEADRRELVRRAYFDLHGLPPTKEQSDAFVGSTDPQAYEKLVDELLSSPHYGERWAQHWLDLVRYAESDGYNQDAYRPAAWPYRDWVIRSLNADLPYDEFVHQQLAGDEMAPDRPEVLVATGYLRNGIYEYNQRDVKGQWELILNDMTDNAGEVFLGLSYGCARCHDHKFDPILQKDYYRLKAFFTPVQWRDDLTLATIEQKKQHAEQQAKWEAATAELRAQMDALAKPLVDAKVKRAYDRFTEDLRTMIDKPNAERTALERQLAGLCVRQYKTEITSFDAIKVLKAEGDKARYKELQEALKKFDELKPAPLPEAFVATDAAAIAPSTMMKTRKAETEIPPGFLTLLAPGDPKIEAKPESSGRRSALAQWISRPDNQLTTRVIVNRVWHYHFGRGLVSTPNDFGKLGSLPSHPELLDWLAQRFVAGGWSLKKLHREMMLSATYRQTARGVVSPSASTIDPENKYLWRFSPRRLDAEQARDAILAASGELDLSSGGASTDGNGTRRSIYTMKKRNSQNELLRSFDAPAGFASTSERQSTTTPIQALLLANGDWTLARARKLAAKVSTVEQAWQLVLGRPPTSLEMERATAFLEKRTAANDAVPSNPPVTGAKVGQFKENTPQERLAVQSEVEEGDEFTVEAVVKLDSIDVNASVRTIASRWNLGKENVESFGWSLGVTGEKSRYKPRNLVVQLVGDDENANLTYEVVASDLRVELGVTYHVSARVSCSAHTVTFQLQQMDKPNAPLLTSVATHRVRGRLSAGSSGLVIGGLHKRAPGHGWDGRIDAARVAVGVLPDEELSGDPAKWRSGFAVWQAKVGPNDKLSWASPDGNEPGAGPRREALADLCHVLLNTNEFFYLH